METGFNGYALELRPQRQLLFTSYTVQDYVTTS